MKKQFTKKSEIHNKIREAFNKNMSITNPDSVFLFTDKIVEEYEIEPETLAYLVQSINRYALANEFKKANNKQTYPKIELINVIKYCRRYGYDNIYQKIKEKLIQKAEEKRMGKESTISDMYSYVFRLQKAASLNNKINELEKDEKFDYLKKLAESKLGYQFDELKDLYWQDSKTMEKFIKASKIEFDPLIKETLDTIRKNHWVTFSKTATLDTFLLFKNTLENFINNYRRLKND